MSFTPFITTTDPYPVPGYPDMFTGRRGRTYIDYFGGPFPDDCPYGTGRNTDTDNQCQADQNFFAGAQRGGQIAVFFKKFLQR
jgi:hypothetical protein